MRACYAFVHAPLRHACILMGVATTIVALPSCADDAKQTSVLAVPKTAKPISETHQAEIAAAENFERLLLGEDPSAKRFISFVDVDMHDRHLIVHMKDAFLVAPQEQAQGFTRAISDLWQSTKYVREANWGGNVEFFQHDGNRIAQRWDLVAAPTVKADEPTNDLAPGTYRVGELIDPRPQAKTADPEPEPEPTPEPKKAKAAAAKAAADEEMKRRSARADGLLRAAASLEKQGKTAGAVKLYQDIERDYADTEASAKAIDRLKSLGEP